MELRKTICFCVDVNHSIQLCNALRDAGVEAEHIDASLTDAQRDDILHRFRRTDASASKPLQVLTNCMIATEGFDAPSCSAVVLARPTKSRGLFMQMVGRGLRTAPGKTECVFFDCSGLVQEHGLPSDPLNYTLENGLLILRDSESDCSRPPIAGSDALELDLNEMRLLRYVQLKITRLDAYETARKGMPVAKLQQYGTVVNRFALSGSDGDFSLDGFTFETTHTFQQSVIGLMVGNTMHGDDHRAAAKMDPGLNLKRYETGGNGRVFSFDVAIFNKRRIYFDDSAGPSKLLEQLVALVGEFVTDEFVTDESDERSLVSAHFAAQFKICIRKGYKTGWVYHRLQARWGDQVLKRVGYDYKTWSKDPNIVNTNSINTVDPQAHPRVPIRVLTLPSSW